MSVDQLEKTAACWDEFHTGIAAQPVYWWDLPAVQREMNRRLSGDPDTGLPEYCCQIILKGRIPVEHCVSLGCGNGHLERDLASLGAFIACTGYDIGPKTLQLARTSAEKAGFGNIEYVLADINHVDYPTGKCDLIIANAVLHHLVNLETALAKIHQALAPDGIFILNEYIGPRQFQFGKKQRELINLTLQLIPQAYRKLPEAHKGQTEQLLQKMTIRRLLAKIRSGRLPELVKFHYWNWKRARVGENGYLEKVRFPTVEDVVAVDPSEAIRSDEIMPVASQLFDFFDVKPLGGAIIQFLLSPEITWNMMSLENSHEILDMILAIENHLTACGELANDFIFAAGRKRGSK